MASSEWTILVYMAADNSLHSFAEKDIIQMQRAVLPEDVNVIVQADFSPDSPHAGSRRYKIHHSESDEIDSQVISELGEQDSGDPHTLNAFARWGFSRYPSQKKMLIIWSHGDSWYKYDAEKWICPDESSQSLFSIANGDMGIALSGIPKLDILLFDACSMQSLEVSSEVSRYADYIVGSADLVPSLGFPYESILPLFGEDIQYILSQLPVVYTDSYAALGSQNPGYLGIPTTCSVISTESLQIFNTRFSAFIMSHRGFAPEIYKYRNMCFEMNTMFAEIDLKELLDVIIEQTLDADLRSEALMLRDLWNEVIVSYSAIEYYQDIGTAAIWYPRYQQQFSAWWNHYRQLQFSETGWLSMLNNSYEKDTIAPETPMIESIDTVMNSLRVRFRGFADPDPLEYEITAITDTDTQILVVSPTYETTTMSHELRLNNIQDGVLRIRAKDLSGNYSTESQMAFSMKSPHRKLLITPNPIIHPPSALLKIYIPEDDNTDSLRLYLYSIRGVLVLEKEVSDIQSGENRILLGNEPKFRSLSSGIYVAVIRYNGKSILTKFSITK